MTNLKYKNIILFLAVIGAGVLAGFLLSLANQTEPAVNQTQQTDQEQTVSQESERTAPEDGQPREQEQPIQTVEAETEPEPADQTPPEPEPQQPAPPVRETPPEEEVETIPAITPPDEETNQPAQPPTPDPQPPGPINSQPINQKTIGTVLANLKLTDHAKELLEDTTIELHSRAELNNLCGTTANNDYKYLGCYYSDRAYILNIDYEPLSYLEEQVTGHEILHAIYEKLSFSERNEINDQLRALCLDSQCSNILQGRYSHAGSLTKINEIHSIAATEVASLPQALEDYYAQFFQDRQLVFSYHQQSVGRLISLNRQLDEKREAIKSNNSQIDIKNNELDLIKIEYDDVISQIEEIISIGSRTPEQEELLDNLLGQKDILETTYDQIRSEVDALIEANNQLIDEYNQMATEYNELLQAYNSL